MNYAKNVQLRTGNSALLCFAEPTAQQATQGVPGLELLGRRSGRGLTPRKR